VETASAQARTRAFGRYSLTCGLFNAAGGLSRSVLSNTRAYFLLYAAIGLATAALALLLSGKVEGEPAPRVFGSFRPLAGLAALFALDSLGGGFVANAVIAYWLHARFGAGPNLLGPIFVVAAVLPLVSLAV